MSTDTFVQVAPDSSGKRVDMGLVDTGAVDSTGTVQRVYRQRAEITGDVADALLAVNQTLKQILAVDRAILAVLSSVSNSPVSEEDFSNPG